MRRKRDCELIFLGVQILSHFESPELPVSLFSVPVRDGTQAPAAQKGGLFGKTRIVFISTMTSAPWGGSEELWADAASRLVHEGYGVHVSVRGWPQPPKRLAGLASEGVEIQSRRSVAPLWRRAYHKLAAQRETQEETDMLSLLSAVDPALVVLSDGNCMPPVSVLRYCASRRMPFVTIGHMSSGYFGSNDTEAAHYRSLLPLAQRCYFVSTANLKIFEKQIGCVLPNAEIIRNPFNVSYDACPAWTPLDDNGVLRLAHVGRLHMPSKGQDLLVEALAGPAWRSRSWRLTLYGDGPMREIIARLIERFGLSEKIHFGGFADSVEKIWSENHVLVMPSRYEGLPLAIIEAMLCSRPALVTDVAGHTEVVEEGVTGFVADYPTVRSIAGALDRVWQNRNRLEAMGVQAGVAVRARIPKDPVKVFVEKLKVAANADRSRQLSS